MIQKPRALVLAAALALLISAVPEWTRPTGAAAPAQTQTITGGGQGRTFASADASSVIGSFSASGQLGPGRISLRVGTPGNIASIIRNDGTRLQGTAATSNECGPAQASVTCLSADLSSSSDIAHAHISVVFVTSDPCQCRIDSFLMRGTLTLKRRVGYVMLGANGTTYAFGGIEHLGDARTTNATDIELTPSHNGYWVTDQAGHVFAFGDAPYFGSANSATFAPGEIVTSMSATRTQKGYWLFTSKGRVFTFGDAQPYGGLRSYALNGPIVGSVATPTSHGYYMVGSDGGVFAFNDAHFRGSMGNARLNQPVIGLVPTPENNGYWLVASDGGVFSFDTYFQGSMGGTPLNAPIAGMVPYGRSYLMIGSDGGVFDFSGGTFYGSLGGTRLPARIVSGAAGS